ncbi:hypothetical protein DVR12_17140 [Chitinophaga silvatica]|uniref:Uncharacterized protein n=1 Tax=Chitinophaga silvatica TaxID=2282649 RepID=A0A3E1Y7L8_9BACT|nr:hypothetical protein DVR12_17140 [Chitinophaga silvatica]
MKILSFTLNIIIVIVIALTPSGFHNDDTRHFDWIILFFVVVNSYFLIKSNKGKIIRGYLLCTLLELVYCLVTVSANDEIGYYIPRLRALGIKVEFISKSKLDILEAISVIIILILIVSELVLIWRTIKDK